MLCGIEMISLCLQKWPVGGDWSDCGVLTFKGLPVRANDANNFAMVYSESLLIQIWCALYGNR